jgi:hypothetical protein
MAVVELLAGAQLGIVRAVRTGSEGDEREQRENAQHGGGLPRIR